MEPDNRLSRRRQGGVQTPAGAIYTGWVRHRRRSPRAHAFMYRVFMMYLRLDQMAELLEQAPGWSANRPALAWFRRRDFLGDHTQTLEEAVRDRVEKACGQRPDGPIYLLANLRYFGFNMNPICCYYCFDRSGQQLQYLLAEVNNTPWNERHSYVLQAQPGQTWLKTRFAKQFHVSPFLPMNMEYRWHSNTPGGKLCLHLENYQAGEKQFDATLSMQAQPVTRSALRRVLLAYPMMTLKVAAAIYWQALRLWLKGTPLYSHPPTSHPPTSHPNYSEPEQ